MSAPESANAEAFRPGWQAIKDAIRPFADAYWALEQCGFIANPKGTALMYNVHDPHFLGPSTYDLAKLSVIFDAMVEADGGSRL